MVFFASIIGKAQSAKAAAEEEDGEPTAEELTEDVIRDLQFDNEDDEEEANRWSWKRIRALPREAAVWMKTPVHVEDEDSEDSDDDDVSSSDEEALMSPRLSQPLIFEMGEQSRHSGVDDARQLGLEHGSRKTRASVFVDKMRQQELKDVEKEKMKAEKLANAPCIVYIVSTNGFEFVACVNIVFATVLLGIDAQCSSGTDACGSALPAVLTMMQYIVAGLFLVEWCLRVAAHGKVYFVVLAHKLDTGVVWLTTFATVVIPLVDRAQGRESQKTTLVLLLHFMRLLRLVRMFEVMKQFGAFRTLVGGILGTQRTLLACCVLLMATVFLFAVLAIELYGASGTVATDINNYDFYFQNGVTWACLEITRFMTMDNAIDHLQHFFGNYTLAPVFFYSFMAISAYVIMNLVTAVIVDHALQMAQANEADVAKELRRKQKRDLKDLKRMFCRLDTDGSAAVDAQEFAQAFENDKMRAKLESLGFEEDELKELFMVLDDDGGEGSLDIKEFCVGISKMKGEAQAKDLLVANKTTEKVLKLMRRYFFSNVVQRKSIQKDDEVTAFMGPVEKSLIDIDQVLKDRMNKIEEKLRLLKRAARQMMSNIELMKQQVPRIKAANAQWVKYHNPDAAVDEVPAAAALATESKSTGGARPPPAGGVRQVPTARPPPAGTRPATAARQPPPPRRRPGQDKSADNAADKKKEKEDDKPTTSPEVE